MSASRRFELNASPSLSRARSPSRPSSRAVHLHPSSRAHTHTQPHAHTHDHHRERTIHPTQSKPKCGGSIPPIHPTRSARDRPRVTPHTHLNALNSGSLRIFSHAPMPCFCTARRSAPSSLASQYPRTDPLDAAALVVAMIDDGLPDVGRRVSLPRPRWARDDSTSSRLRSRACVRARACDDRTTTGRPDDPSALPSCIDWGGRARA